MKRKVSLILLLALGASMAMAQTTEIANDSTISKKIAEETKPAVAFPRHYVGVRAGLNLSDMIYSYSELDRYQHFLQPQPMVGVFGHFQLGKSHFAIRPEVSYVGRADSLNWLDVQYRFKAHYFDLRMPLTYNIRFKNSHFSPYLMAVPQVDLAMGGKVSYRDETDYPTGAYANVTKADINRFDGALLLGIGFDYLIETSGMPVMFSMEAGYNWGFHNTFAPREIKNNPNVIPGTESNIANFFYGCDLWQETRNNRGIEVAVRLSLPIDGSWKKKNKDNLDQDKDQKANELTIVDTVRHTVIIVDTVHHTVEHINNVYRNDTIDKPVFAPYTRKDCYSFEDIIEFLEQGEDITDKRLCLFNINFDFDSDKLREGEQQSLNELAELMKKYANLKIKIYGHTDSRGDAAYNLDLSNRRAGNVEKYMNEHGIDTNRMATEGLGEEFPFTSNATSAGRAKNRRVEIEFVGLNIYATEQATKTK